MVNSYQLSLLAVAKFLSSPVRSGLKPITRKKIVHEGGFHERPKQLAPGGA